MSQKLRLSRLYYITGNVTDTTLIVVYFESCQFEKFGPHPNIATDTLAPSGEFAKNYGRRIRRLYILSVVWPRDKQSSR